MKTTIAVISPSTGIGGGDRKFKIYYKYLDEKIFDKKIIFLTIGNEIKKTKEGYYIGTERIVEFLKKEKIIFTYVSSKHVTKKLFEEIKEVTTILWNVNFTDLYKKDPKVINLVISKTDYWKIRWIQQESLLNSHVVYNPIDYSQWTNLAKKTKGIYREKLPNTKFIIGRIARAEPTKWNYLIIKTLLLLQKRKNYNYGFIFAGMPQLYRLTLQLFLNKKMKENIIFLPEMSSFENIAEFYSSIDLFWQTSLVGESFGNVIAESFCFEVPVLTDYKAFRRKDGTITKNRYDAQIEVVDNNINGFAHRYPESIVARLQLTTKKELKELGKKGKEKVAKTYDAKFAGETIAKILLDHQGIKNSLKQIPSEVEVQQYNKEYQQRVKDAKQSDKLVPKEKQQSFLRQEKLWNKVELLYTLIRKILRIIGIEIEPEKQ